MVKDAEFRVKRAGLRGNEARLEVKRGRKRGDGVWLTRNRE